MEMGPELRNNLLLGEAPLCSTLASRFASAVVVSFWPILLTKSPSRSERWLKGVDLSGELAPRITDEDGVLRLTLGDRQLLYDSLGLRLA